MKKIAMILAAAFAMSTLAFAEEHGAPAAAAGAEHAAPAAHAKKMKKGEHKAEKKEEKKEEHKM